MNFADYQEKAFYTCTHESYCDDYLDLGYISEVGELAGKLAKRIRGDFVSDEDIMHEIGDCAWMCAIRDRLHGMILSNVNCFPYAIFSIKHGIEMLLISGKKSCFYELNRFCNYLGFDFNKCLEMNIKKLESRKERGVIKGSGDNR